MLDNSHPRHLDLVAARFPELKIIAAPSRLAVAVRDDRHPVAQGNVWYELHGWSPRYLTDELKREIPRRLQDRVLFGADYPLFSYDRLRADWAAQALAGAGKAVPPQRRTSFRPWACHGPETRGQVALVNGASQGIGYGIARTLAEEGASSPSRRAARGAVARPPNDRRRNRRIEPLAVPADCRRAEDCAMVVAQTVAHFGGVDILVNNDGAPPLGDLLGFDDDAWRKAIEQNLMSVVRLTRAAVPHMKEAAAAAC